MRVHFHSDTEEANLPICPQLPELEMCDHAPRPLSTCLSCPHSSHAFCGHATAFSTSGDISPFGMQ